MNELLDDVVKSLIKRFPAVSREEIKIATIVALEYGRRIEACYHPRPQPQQENQNDQTL